MSDVRASTSTCRSASTRCGYCDFNAYAGLDHLAPRYLRALLAEAGLAAPAWADDEVVVDLLRRRHADDAGRRRPEGVADARPRPVRGARRRRGHRSRRTPTRVDIATAASGCSRAGFDRLSMGAQSFDRGVLASLERLHSPDSVRRGVRRRPRRRLREREPRPHLRRGRRGPGFVGADAGAGDRRWRRSTSARTRSRSSRRRRSAARSQTRRGAGARSRPAGRHVLGAACDLLRDAGYQPLRGLELGEAGVRVPAQPRVLGAAAATSGSAPARTRSATTAAGGTSARLRSYMASRSRRAAADRAATSSSSPSDAYLEEVFLRLRILRGHPVVLGRRRRSRCRSSRAACCQEDGGSLVPDGARHAAAERAGPGARRRA